MTKTAVRFAILLTIIWVAFWIFTIAIEWQNFKTLSFNEVGDFMAGAFGPVAFLWLVLGFFQQGEELKNNVEALKLQAEELRQSVEQQREMVAVTRETFEHEKKIFEQQKRDRLQQIEPKFKLRRASPDPRDLYNTSATIGAVNLEVFNEGGTAYEVEATIYPKNGIFTASKKADQISKGQSILLSHRISSNPFTPSPSKKFHYFLKTSMATSIR